MEVKPALTEEERKRLQGLITKIVDVGEELEEMGFKGLVEPLRGVVAHGNMMCLQPAEKPAWRVACPLHCRVCQFVMTGSGHILCCLNPKCSEYELRYRAPTFELERV
jgi:hypothetical protein